ncbi:MAG: flagellar filament capping protein FliD [Terracidiphilus sp.]
MGTVGLSFGSPTSGTGFDVSTTVSEIVANLQNVETPWKDQLTTLESQDTVISNLGTLVSNLSNDVSSLTDFNGILAEKTGSSSNTNVLELTSASTSAVAGTHTVLVNSLASTSSGYLAEIPDASDTLTGSITLQVGTSGTSQTFTLDSSDNTLAGLAAAINSSNAGINASVLTDATGSRLSLVSDTSGANGNIVVSSNSITDTSSGSGATLGYTPAVTGTNASLTVDGVNLTSSSNTVSNLIPGLTFQLLSTSSDPVQVVIGNDNSDVESTVNQFVTDYNSLVSAINTQEGNTSSGTAEPLFGSPTLSLLQEQMLGSINTPNPNGNLDTIANAGDTLSGSIAIQVGSGDAQTIDVPSSNSTLAGLAAAINSANIGVTANVETSSNGSQLEFVSGTAGPSGALTVTSNVTDTTTNTALNYTSGDTDINNLTSLGISVNDDGTLTFDADSLDTVLNTDYNSVVGFFQNANGWGQSFADMLNNAGTSSPTGILSLASSSNSNIESTLNAEISKENSMISAEQSSLTTELNSANEIMQQLPTELNGMNELYSAITGYDQTTNG